MPGSAADNTAGLALRKGLSGPMRTIRFSLIKNQVGALIYKSVSFLYSLRRLYLLLLWPAVPSSTGGPFLFVGNPRVRSRSMTKKKIVHFRQEWLSKLPLASEEGELVTCPACLGQHPLIYEDEQRTEKSWGYVECDWEYVLAVVEGKVLADTLLKVDEQ